jgi:hypothetical protein
VGKRRKGRAVRKALAKWRAASNLLKGIKTGVRSAPRSNYLNPALAKYREGAHSDSPTGVIIRNPAMQLQSRFGSPIPTPNDFTAYIVVLVGLMLVAAVWRYRQRDLVWYGGLACLLITGSAAVLLALRVSH